MAQSGYTPIVLYTSTTPGVVPTAGNLVTGELGLNAADGKLFYKNSGNNTVTQLAGLSGYSGYSGGTGTNGTSGYSGYSGFGGTTLSTTDFTATSGQTVFTVTYSPTLLQGVYRNGVKLGLTDYTATNGTSITLATGATTGDLVQVQSFVSSSVVGTSGYSGYSGYSGTNGTNGASGTSGYSGTNGSNGTSGFSGYSGTNGTNGASGTSGYSGTNGSAGSTGTSGYSGYSGATGAGASTSFNSIGSYCEVRVQSTSFTVAAGSNYAAGASSICAAVYYDTNPMNSDGYNVLSGTWKWMGGGGTYGYPASLGVRIA